MTKSVNKKKRYGPSIGGKLEPYEN